jgi:hypothetical protein
MGSSFKSIQTYFPPAQIVIVSIILSDPPFKDKSFLHQKYVVEGLTCGEIAAQIFSARTTVLKYLKLHGIPVREIGTNQKRKRGLGYGQKVQGRQVENHQREQENIKKMRELRDKGYSYWKIAEVFNTLKIPTKTRKGCWHAKTIHQILFGDLKNLPS